MRPNNSANSQYTLAEHKQKIISDLNSFLNYKRANSIDFGSRLLKDFKVIGFKYQPDRDSIFVEFEGYDVTPHANHYWVSIKELESFTSGSKNIGVNLFVDRSYSEQGHIILEVNMVKNGFKKMTIYDAEKLKGIFIKYDNRIFKSYDVQVSVKSDMYIDKLIRIFVIEPNSSEDFINKNTVTQNRIHIKNGITFEDFHTQENFVRKFDALEAVRIERRTVIDELRSWYSLNIDGKVDAQYSEAFYKKLKEIL
jgi:hypothetical protein